MKLEFKVKNVGGTIRFPNSFKRSHVIRENGDTSRLERFYNSDMFLNMLQIHIKKEMRLPLGMTVFINDLPDCVIIEPGFLDTVTINL